MVVEQMIDAMMIEIKKNLECFCQESSEEALSLESAEAVCKGIQETLAGAGRAGFTTYLKANEEVRDIIVVDGETYRFKAFTNKAFVSLWGGTSISRKIFQNGADTKSYCPMDEAWGMANEYLTIEVREASAYASGLVTPEEVAGLFEKSTLFHPHPTQIKNAAEQIAARVAPCRAEVDRAIREEEQVPGGTRVLVASMDGVNVLLNEPGKKQGRPAERPKGEDKQSKTAYKNAMVGVVSFYGEVKEGEKCPERLDARYVSHMPEERALSFKEKFEAELDDAVAQCPSDVTKVVLCDGARGIWSYIDNAERFKGFEKLIDYWHAVEHLSLAAEALFGKGSEEGKAWYEKYAAKLKEEERGAQCALDSMDYYGGTRKLSSTRRKDLNTQRTFFARNKHRMTYADFRWRGLPIGSGPVEAACKSLVKARLCRSGMRWSRAGGQRILDFRTYIKSKRWDKFWKQYKNLKSAV